MEKVQEILNNIREGLKQQSSSQKDEILVMKAMLNDRDYNVGVYSKEGQIGTFCPAEEARTMITSVISGATKVSTAEAKQLANEYEFTKNDAQNMINISKEFVNTYLETGRKLPLGGRETSDVSLVKKEVEESTRTFPKQIGLDDQGNKIYETSETKVPAHNSVKVFGSCPSWLK